MIWQTIIKYAAQGFGYVAAFFVGKSDKQDTGTSGTASLLMVGGIIVAAMLIFGGKKR